MRVAIDAHMIGERESGNERYTLNLLKGLASLPDDGTRYSVLTPNPPALDGLDLPAPFRVVRVRPATSALRIPIGMPAAVRRERAQLLHVTYIAPPVPLCRTVVTVHDVSFLAHPEWLNRSTRLMLRALVPGSVRRAATVIAISEFTKRDLMRRYQLAAERIAVVPLAPDPGFSPMPDAAGHPLPAGLRDPFILAVGNLEPRKNLQRLMEAVAVLARDGRFSGCLAIVGKSKYQAPTVTATVARLGLEGRVIFTGHVDDATLRLLYNRAAMFVYPSLYEGFGLPLLEAMACGCPVVASDATAIPETVGDAALLVQATAVPSISEAIARLLSDPGLARRLSTAGRARAGRFTWADTARKTREIYRAAG